MSNNTRENTATPMLSHESSLVNEERKTSSESTRLTWEEAREMLAEYEEIGRRYLEYITKHNMRLTPCPAAKRK